MTNEKKKLIACVPTRSDAGWCQAECRASAEHCPFNGGHAYHMPVRAGQNLRFEYVRIWVLGELYLAKLT